MTYPEFEARWRPAGGAERANYGLFLQDLCDLLGVPRLTPAHHSGSRRLQAGEAGEMELLLATLTVLGLPRRTEEGAYAA